MARDLASFPKPARAFQQAFEKAVARWVSGEYDHEYTETWIGFRQRVGAALDELIDLAGGADVIVSTSGGPRSEEHTSELQSRPHLVCRLLLEKKKKQKQNHLIRKLQIN